MQLQKRKDRILACDQALNQSGWAVFDDKQQLQECGIITPNKKDVGDRRFVSVRNAWIELIERFKPTILCLEPPFGDSVKDDERGGITFSILNGTFWMLKEIAARYYIKVVEIPAATWQNRCGIFKRDRFSRKSGARKFAIETYKLPESLEQDIYDACCIGYTYFYHQQFKPNSQTVKVKKEKKEERPEVSAF